MACQDKQEPNIYEHDTNMIVTYCDIFRPGIVTVAEELGAFSFHASPFCLQTDLSLSDGFPVTGFVGLL